MLYPVLYNAQYHIEQICSTHYVVLGTKYLYYVVLGTTYLYYVVLGTTYLYYVVLGTIYLYCVVLGTSYRYSYIVLGTLKKKQSTIFVTLFLQTVVF